MAADKGSSHRDSAFLPLSVQPVDVSLTAGTNIPAPPDSPPQSPARSLARSASGGPLNSHPTTPDAVPGAFPPTPEPDHESAAPPHPAQDGPGGLRVPQSPTSASAVTTSPKSQRRPPAVRKLLSLSSLRSSFSSSRTSLLLPRASHDHEDNPTNAGASVGSTGVKRPSSPSVVSTTGSSLAPPRPPLRPRTSGSWFRRKSSLFMMNGTKDSGLDVVDENQTPDSRESKRVKESSPAPRLPDIGTLRGGTLDGGNMDWDEGLFKR